MISVVLAPVSLYILVAAVAALVLVALLFKDRFGSRGNGGGGDGDDGDCDRGSGADRNPDRSPKKDIRTLKKEWAMP